jgi:ABC-type branched-subunit amino acid transport system substrate-binding protein
LAAVFVLITTACGARLTQQQREDGIRVAAGLGGSGTTTTTGGTTDGTTTGGGGGSTTGGGGTTGGSGTGGGGTTGGGGSTGGGGGTSSGGGSTGGGGGGGGSSSGGGSSGGSGGGGGGSSSAGSSTCDSGGATDKGVTADEIKLATIYDGTGVQGGLFNSAFQATQAAAAYFNSEGGICGRQVKIDAYDDHTESTGNRAATQNACTNDFAIVGSMSAFDDGGVPVIKSCGIPDIAAVPVTPQHETADTTHAAYPNRGDYFVEAYPKYIAKHYPDVIKHAGIIWLNASAPRSNAQARMSAYEKAGFQWDYHQEVQAVEPNYAPYVAAMRQNGIEYLTMVGNWQSIGRLLDAAAQQQWRPTVMDWDSVVYDPGFVEQYGQQAEGSLFYMNAAPLEEARSNKEVALYLYWLNKTCGDCTPTYFGEYAWSAARLFQSAAEQVKGNLTREALLKVIEGIHEWNDYGLSATHDPGRNLPSSCIFYGKIQGGKFVRVDPAGSGFDCSLGGLLHQ